jgi:hypothetical protein
LPLAAKAAEKKAADEAKAEDKAAIEKSSNAGR